MQTPEQCRWLAAHTASENWANQAAQIKRNGGARSRSKPCYLQAADWEQKAFLAVKNTEKQRTARITANSCFWLYLKSENYEELERFTESAREWLDEDAIAELDRILKGETQQ